MTPQNSNDLVAKGQFIGQGKLEIIPNFQKTFYPSLGREGVMPPGGVTVLGKVHTSDGLHVCKREVSSRGGEACGSKGESFIPEN